MEAIRLYRAICRQPTFPYSYITQWIIQVPRTRPLTAYQEAAITNPPKAKHCADQRSQFILVESFQTQDTLLFSYIQRDVTVKFIGVWSGGEKLSGVQLLIETMVILQPLRQ